MKIHIKDFLKHIDDNTEVTGVTSKEFVVDRQQGKLYYEYLIDKHAPKRDNFLSEEEYDIAYHEWRIKIYPEIEWCRSIDRLDYTVQNSGYILNNLDTIKDDIKFNMVAYCLLENGTLNFTIPELRKLYDCNVQLFNLESYEGIMRFADFLTRTDVDIYRLQNSN